MMHCWQTSGFALSSPSRSPHLSEKLRSEALRAERTSSNLWLSLCLSHNHVILASSAQLPAPLFSLLHFQPHPSLHSPRAALQFSPPLLALSRSLPPSSRTPDLSRCIGDGASCMRSSSAQHKPAWSFTPYDFYVQPNKSVGALCGELGLNEPGHRSLLSCLENSCHSLSVTSVISDKDP